MNVLVAQVQSSIGKQARLSFLNALLAQKKNKPASEVLPILNDVVDIHCAAVKVRGVAVTGGRGGGRG